MKRRQPTPKERKAIHARQNGTCAGPDCDAPLGDRWDADHTHALALGGSNDLDNLRGLCLDCHDAKTNGTKATTYGSDKHAIAKAKRIAAGGRKRRGPAIAQRVNPWPPKGSRKMQSRGWK